MRFRPKYAKRSTMTQQMISWHYYSLRMTHIYKFYYRCYFTESSHFESKIIKVDSKTCLHFNLKFSRLFQIYNLLNDLKRLVWVVVLEPPSVQGPWLMAIPGIHQPFRFIIELHHRTIYFNVNNFITSDLLLLIKLEFQISFLNSFE